MTVTSYPSVHTGGYVLERFRAPRAEARAFARQYFVRYNKGGYMTSVDSFSEVGDDEIEFTMRRLPSAE